MVKGKVKQKKNNPTVTPKKVMKKAVKSKRLSQVKTPEALKTKKGSTHVKKKPVKSADKMAKGEKKQKKMKGLSQVKTPEALKTKKVSTTTKKKRTEKSTTSAKI
ncbi:hypothetical protein Lser_V15G22006 [Lactuca serriola]